MNRSLYFNYIEEKLIQLATRINLRGKLNILDFHLHSEHFYAYFLNELYGWNLSNENASKQNVEAIDLIDSTNAYVVQVSATNTKQKIEKSLEKDLIAAYSNYTFKFISISKEASSLRDKTFKNPHNINFNPQEDIIDVDAILKFISTLDIDKQKLIYKFIKKELGVEVDIPKLDSNLATIINILSKEDLSAEPNATINSFEIERKITHNQLSNVSWIIEEYSMYHSRLDKKYQEFDKQGANKSFSVLQMIRKCYIEEVGKSQNANNIFMEVIEKVKNKVIECKNFIEIPSEELEICVNVLVVDAFIRCKIFENPEKYNHAAT